MDLIENLKKERLKNNLQVQDVAKVLNITPSAYGHYEKYRRKVDIETLLKLSKYYKKSINYFLGIEEEKTKINMINLTETQKEIFELIKEMNEQQAKAVYHYILGLLQKDIITKENFNK